MHSGDHLLGAIVVDIQRSVHGELQHVYMSDLK